MERGFKPGELFLALGELHPKVITHGTYQRRQRPIKPRASLTVTHHYTPIRKLGFPDGVRCWCGNELTFRYGEHGKERKRKQWFDQHDLCEAPQALRGQ